VAKHRGTPDPDEVSRIMSDRERDQNFQVPDAERVEKDVNIVDNGWNNTPRNER
jgi:hypothetical protein